MRPWAALRSAAIAIVLPALLLTGCATRDAPTPRSLSAAPAEAIWQVMEAQQAYARGRADVYAELAADDAFRVTDYQLSACRIDISWLPSTGAIADAQFWQARKRNMWLLKRCRARNDAKIAVIYRMIDRVRRGE